MSKYKNFFKNVIGSTHICMSIPNNSNLNYKLTKKLLNLNMQKLVI